MKHRILKAGEPYKTAYIWIALLNGAFFGADLFFSSVEKFKEHGIKLGAEDGFLFPVRVPPEFDDWDYVPDNY